MKIEKDELSIYDVENLYKELLEELKKADLTVDMTDVNRIDMSIIQLFLSLQKGALEESKIFELTNVTPEVKQIMQNAACDSLLLIGETDG